MKKNYTLLTLFAAFLLLTIISCKKDDNDSPAAPTCLLSKSHYFDGSTVVSDSIIYTHTAGKITKLSNAAGYAELEYTNGKVTKRNFFDAGSTTADAYDVAAYNGDGSLSSIKTYFTGLGAPLLFSQYDFIYTAGKLSKMDVQEYSLDSSRLLLVSSSTYTHSGSNISQSVTTYYDPAGGAPDFFTLNYTYDSNPNYFVSSNAIFTDYLFFDGIDGSVIPLIVSTNNVVKAVDGADETIISYSLDAKKNFYEFIFDGELAARYFYDCK